MTRRQVVALGAATLLGQWARKDVAAARAPGEPLRVGLVVPSRTGATPVRASVYEAAGEAARMGAMLAEADLAGPAEAAGRTLQLLLANSPGPAAAQRAAERLVELEGVEALVGGLGDGQAEAIMAVTESRGIPFFNIGSPDPALRHERLGRFTFHIEASADMYLDALIGWYSSSGRRRWFVVYEDSPGGSSLHERALRAMAKHGAAEAGRAAVPPGKPYYGPELAAIEASGADVTLLILNPGDEMAFLAQHDSQGPNRPIVPSPTPVNQTRHFFTAIRHAAPRASLANRVVLWETTLDVSVPGSLNERFTAQWGQPMDPSAWAAYAALAVVVQATAATGTTDGEALAAYMEDPSTTFDLHKGVELAFRPGNHQLYQPLYLVALNPASSVELHLSDRLAAANLVGELPALYVAEEQRLEAIRLLGVWD